MKVVKNNDDNKPLTLAELEELRQFEASERDGQAVFHPQMAAGQPAPSCVLLLEGIGRFAITILEGRHAVENGRWFLQEATGAMAPVDNPLEQAWQAAKSVRTALRRELDLNTYVIPVAWFPDMEEDEAILDEAGGRSVQLLFGQVDLAERLVNLPREDELQTHLGRRYTKREVAALSRPAAVDPDPAEGPRPVNGRAGAMHIGRVETMNVHITVIHGHGADDTPPLAVQGR